VVLVDTLLLNLLVGRLLALDLNLEGVNGWANLVVSSLAEPGPFVENDMFYSEGMVAIGHVLNEIGLGFLFLVGVPDRILIAFVGKLRLYGLRCANGRFAEFLKVLEKDGAICWGGAAGAAPVVGSVQPSEMALGRFAYLLRVLEKGNGRFAELWRNLEKSCAMGSTGAAVRRRSLESERSSGAAELPPAIFLRAAAARELAFCLAELRIV
jgi:hypothetical protein